MDNILTLTHATERDVDLLLVEEFKCSPDFVFWFTDRVSTLIGQKISFSTSEVVHSKRRTHNRREIDITLILRKRSGCPTFIFIENKLDTSEQFQQAESYRSEAELLLRSGRADAAVTVLICPRSYSDRERLFAAKFDGTVHYEAVSTFLRERAETQNGELGARLLHHHELLQQAVEKSRRGYQAVPMAAIERFNARYVELCAKHFPGLIPGPSMLKEGPPGESKTMIFHSDILPKWTFLPRMRIVHQLREGNANICFYGWGDQFTKLAQIMGSDLGNTTYRVVPTINKRAAGRSGLMIVAETPSIDNLQGFDAQSNAILAGMHTTENLRKWFWENEKVIAGWANLFDEFNLNRAR